MERYNGPTFGVLRRYLRECPNNDLDAYVLSARYGLIAGTRPIPAYDEKLTPQRANELKQELGVRVDEVLGAKEYTHILICAGGDYVSLLTRSIMAAATSATVNIASGTPGRQLTLLHHWLYGKVDAPELEDVDHEKPVTISVRGVDVTLSPAEAMVKLRDALEAEQGKPEHFQSWYALVEGRRVSIKWVVAQLTGLPVSAFHTDDAKRVLQRLGISIHVD